MVTLGEAQTVRRWRIAAAALMALVLAEQVRIWAALSSRYVTEDQTLLWAAARAWGRGKPRSPLFWGQRYGVTFEAVPAEFLRWFGVPLHVGLPAALTVLNLASWWLPAAALWWRGRYTVSMALLVAPALLVPDYSVIASVYGTGFGRFLIGIAMAVAIAWPRHVRAAAATLGLSALAVLMDSSAAIVAVPLVVWVLPTIPRTRRGIATAALGLMPAAMWFGVTRWYLALHPDEDLHPAPVFEPTWSILRDNLSHLGRHFDVFTLQVLPTPVVPLVLLAAIGIALTIQRAWLAVAAWGSGIAVTALVLSVPKSLDGLGTVFFRTGRVMMPFPLFVALALVMMGEAGARPRLPLRAILAVSAAVVVCGRFLVLGPYLDRLAERAEAEHTYPVRLVDEQRERCRTVSAVAQRTGISLAVFYEDRTSAYGCAALDRSLVTLFPLYERRSWLLRRFAVEEVEAMVVWDLPNICDDPNWQAVTLTCDPDPSGAVVITTEPEPAIDTIFDLGLPLRPFGDDCHPNEPETCIWFRSRYF